jgi:hypothetical protein
MAAAALPIQPEDKTVPLKLSPVQFNDIWMVQGNSFYSSVLEG